MEWLGRKANDGEGVESSSVCSHGDEVVGRGAVRVEDTLDGAIGKVFLGGREWCWGCRK